MIPAISVRKSRLTFTSCLVALVLFVTGQTGRSQWTKATGLESGSVSCLARGTRFLYAGTPDRGVFRSADSGASWIAVNSGLTNPTIFSLAAGGDYLLAGTYGSGVFVSTNGGESWAAANDGLTNLYIYSLAVRDSEFLAGTVEGIFRSTDRGTVWTPANAGITDNSIRVLAVIDSNLFAGTLGGGAFRTRDAGKGWTSVSNGLTDLYLQTFAACGHYLFTGTYGGLFRSNNAGLSWSMVDVSIPPGPSPAKTVLKDKTVYALAAHGTKLFVGSWLAGVLLTGDYGATWTTVNAGLPAVSVYAIVTDGTYLVVGTYGSGIWRRPVAEMGGSTTDPVGSEPTALTLEQNYPNPFNPRTTIRYSLPAASQVSLALYNTLGEMVAEILNADQQAGDHEVQFDGTGLASGIYFYRLSVGGQKQTRKAVLVR